MFAKLVHWFSPVDDQILYQSTTERGFRPCDNTHTSANSIDKNQPPAISGLSHRPPSCFRLQFYYAKRGQLLAREQLASLISGNQGV